MEQVKIPAHLAEKAQTSIDELFEKLVGVQALVVASIDGFAVVSKSIVEVDANKIAAMASSFSSLGVVVAQESLLGNKKIVTLEADGGYVVLLDIKHAEFPMILSISASSDVVLAHMLYLARESVNRIAAE